MESVISSTEQICFEMSRDSVALIFKGQDFQDERSLFVDPRCGGDPRCATCDEGDKICSRYVIHELNSFP